MDGNMKILGKRRRAQGRGILAADGLMHLAVVLRGNKPFIPKGVHRFKTHEESNAWSLSMMTRQKNLGRQR